MWDVRCVSETEGAKPRERRERNRGSEATENPHLDLYIVSSLYRVFSAGYTHLSEEITSSTSWL